MRIWHLRRTRRLVRTTGLSPFEELAALRATITLTRAGGGPDLVREVRALEPAQVFLDRMRSRDDVTAVAGGRGNPDT